MIFPLTLLFLSWSTDLVVAQQLAQGNQSCSLANQRLQIGTYQFTSDCDSMWFCNSTQICDWKGCRRDEFPFGYAANVTLPDLCPKGEFCPDEEDTCQSLLEVGSPCQFDRDDQCLGPPNFKELADTTGFGTNVNGSVCLNNVCMWANQTAGSSCTVENTPYIVYTTTTEFIDIVSRDDCQVGLYCDSQQKTCMQQKDLNVACAADKECSSFNCLASGVCGKAANSPNHVATWVYAIIGVCIFGGMIATLIGMFFLHKGQRDQEREKRMQYWREQNALRQNILQMQETARHSLMSLPMEGTSQRNSVYSRDGGSEESQLPMLNAGSKGSALRHYVSDDGMGDSDDSLPMKRSPEKMGGRF